MYEVVTASYIPTINFKTSCVCNSTSNLCLSLNNTILNPCIGVFCSGLQNSSFGTPEENGRAVAQAVSRRLPTAAARVRAQVRSCRICGGQSGTGEGFLRVLRFPLPILIPPTAPHSSSPIIRGWYDRPNSGRRTKWTQSHPTTRILKKGLKKAKHMMN
jgi:hypothetical protein